MGIIQGPYNRGKPGKLGEFCGACASTFNKNSLRCLSNFKFLNLIHLSV